MSMMKNVAIVSGVRTPFGRALKGGLKDTRPDVLGATAIKEALARAKGIKAERPGIRVVPLTRFEKRASIDAVVASLFGSAGPG